ncbi:MAG: RHS repeat protein [Acidobacteria bacterium]|nr:RHS repeat protein [Acidobacteriota bacterium]
MEYDAEWTTVTDPALKARKQRVDGMGRMVEVVEDPGALNYGTTYAYDVTDNLLQVTQGVQNRYYSYSTLGRLLQASNPESGNTNYSYMESGDLLTRTDARNISAAYSYDALQRLLTKDYSDSTPDVTYEYHTSATSTAPDIGNLKSASSSVASAYYVYNSLGNVAASAHGISGYGGDLIFSYDWYLNGALRGMQYPSGREVNYDVDDAGRTNKVYSGALNYADMTAAGINYPFTAGGRVAQMKLGNNLWETMDYQAPGTTTHYRLGTTLGSGNVVEIGYNFWATENNGNVASQVINRPGRTWTQNYTYDNLNRLFTANESGSWSREYGYDRYGNRWVASSQGLAYADSREPTLPSHFSNATNRLTTAGAQFDAAGNQTTYTPYDLAYDAENRNIAVTSTGNGNGAFAYDGDGQRVKKVWTPYGGAATTTYYVYDALGKLAAEYSSQAPASAGTSYLFADMLGSVRTITNSSGTVVENYDYLPFGRMLSSSDYNRANMNFPANPDAWIDSNAPQKFTGKERDETGLDYFLFRNYSGAQGRFLSPDPANFGARVANPQSWNAYSYVLNNPLRYVDPFGLSEWCYQDGAAMSCDATNTWLTAGAGVVIPADMPLSFYDGKSFNLLIVGAETPLTYASFSALSMLNEWNGRFLTNEQFYDIQRASKTYEQHLNLNAQELANLMGSSVDQALGWINQGSYGETGSPWLAGGNWNFTLNENAPVRLRQMVNVSKDKRYPGWNSLHLHSEPSHHFHVDTASGGNPWYGSLKDMGLWLIHGAIDVGLGETIFSPMGFPR